MCTGSSCFSELDCYFGSNSAIFRHRKNHHSLITSLLLFQVNTHFGISHIWYRYLTRFTVLLSTTYLEYTWDLRLSAYSYKSRYLQSSLSWLNQYWIPCCSFLLEFLQIISNNVSHIIPSYIILVNPYNIYAKSDNLLT